MFYGKLSSEFWMFISLHDRKMFVLGFCTLLNLPHDKRPAELGEVANEILPSMILVFKGLKRAYESKFSACF